MGAADRVVGSLESNVNSLGGFRLFSDCERFPAVAYTLLTLSFVFLFVE